MNSYMPGGTILWKYVVNNCGNVPLSNIIVTDDNGTPGNQADDWSLTYVSGDTSKSVSWISMRPGDTKLRAPLPLASTPTKQ